MKDRTQKTAPEMDFAEFHIWATGYVLFAIGEGRTLKEAIYAVVHQAEQNEVWGGKKQRERWSD